MNLLIGTSILVFLLWCCVYFFVDVCEECRFQTAAAEHDEVLDRLWSDE